MISDTSFRLYDANGNPVAFAGIAKPVPEHLIEEPRAGDYLAETNALISQQLFPILAQEFQVNRLLPQQEDTIEYFIPFGEKQVHLTKREAQCLYYFFQGKSAKQIGRLLDISYRTVELYFDRLRNKLSARSRIELFTKVNDRKVVDSWQFPHT